MSHSNLKKNNSRETRINGPQWAWRSASLHLSLWERGCAELSSPSSVLVQQSTRLEFCIQISYWLSVWSHSALHFPSYAFLSVCKLSPGYSNCWVKILLSQCQPFLVSAEEYAVVKHRSNSQLEPRDAKLSELSCSCFLFLTDIERVLTSPLDFLACNIQSWAELWWTEFRISSQNIKQINPTQHSMIPFQLLPWGINVSNGKLTWAHQHGREMMATPPWLSLKEDLFWREYEGEKGDCLLKTFQVSELQVSYSHLCAQEDHRTDCLGNYTKAHEK